MHITHLQIWRVPRSAATWVDVIQLTWKPAMKPCEYLSGKSCRVNIWVDVGPPSALPFLLQWYIMACTESAFSEVVDLVASYRKSLDGCPSERVQAILDFVGREEFDLSRCVSSCRPNPCVYGRCIEHGANYTCECETGYFGEHCDECKCIRAML